MGEGESSNDTVILEGVGWKRRGGFGIYNESLGIGKSWERRRFALTSSKLSYYDVDNNDTTSPDKLQARGTLDILVERATCTATYPSANTNQPTPYALKFTTPDLSGSESTKWKLCFDDRETQLIWLVALTEIVSDASVKEYNAKVLKAEDHKSEHGGFHRLYEETDRPMLDLVHGALLMGGYEGKRGNKEGGASYRKQLSSFHQEGSCLEETTSASKANNDAILCESTDTTVDSTIATSPVAALSNAAAAAFFGSSAEEQQQQKGNNENQQQLSVEKLYQAISVIVVSLFIEKGAGITSSSLLWQLVNVIILIICFAPSGAKLLGGRKKEDLSKLVKQSSPSKKVHIKHHKDDASEQVSPLKPIAATTKPTTTAGIHKPAEGAHGHERWAESAAHIDLSGQWTLIADETFKAEYDMYLKQLGFNGITRRVACGVIARTTEITKQSDNGRELNLKGTNPKGAWERTLTASGFPDFETHPERRDGEDFSHVKTLIKTADSEDVDAEAWWEERGTKHRSWLRGGKKYGGGDFESLRYIKEGSDSDVLVCASIFHPKDNTKNKAVVTWRFQRDKDSLKPSALLTKAMLETELMKVERVPLSDQLISERFTFAPADDEHQLEPLTEREMEAHLHERWAQSAPKVDLSGEWTLIADDAFKAEYDSYLKQLGFNGITRRVACGLIARTTEITKQSDNGRELYLKGTNPKGAWERSLIASGYPDFETHPERKEGDDYSHTKTAIKTADAEDVDAEAWWEERGTKHRSWLRGGRKYGGGDFESLRYIKESSDGNVLVCESIFYPRDKSKNKAAVTWRFQRDPLTSA